ncbi:OmpA family protein [Arenibacter sp. TNZ]|uniref:OmpA family protein n=1 Tax=Arenibacter TaxID=178469 RepID=UPI000CD46831|nr:MULTISPECIES: OmpA family protein [Arenibacter]MCM4170133.1 OmpA family protein [Arenibacter sp. TNZ]
MMKFTVGCRNWIWILGVLCHGQNISQNLVENPSFESFLECPDHLGNFGQDLKYWSVPTLGSTDYFNTCSLSMGVPKNFMGHQASKFGDGYLGFYMYAPGDYREYIQGELSQPLEKDLSYSISFYLNLAENSDYAIRDFDILLSSRPLEIKIKKGLTKWQLSKIEGNNFTFIEILGDHFFTDENLWTKVSTTFVANGSERFITLGNFKDNATTRRKKLAKEKSVKGAYYYLDMVYLGEGIQSYALDETHVFENVFFDFDEFQVQDIGTQEIKRVFNYLQSDKTLQIVINGYTDGLGTTSYNMELSVNRAAAVADRLIQLGLARKRITWNGFGAKRPIANNGEEEGRALNRRVEFIISKSFEK